MPKIPWDKQKARLLERARAVVPTLTLESTAVPGELIPESTPPAPPVKRKPGRPKGSKTKNPTNRTIAKDLLTAHFTGADTVQMHRDGSVAIVTPQIGRPVAMKLPPALSLAAQMRDSWERANLRQVLQDIAEGNRRANREQLEAIKLILERGWGRAPETHFVASVGAESAAAVAELTKDQLLGLLDGPDGSGPDGMNRSVLATLPSDPRNP